MEIFFFFKNIKDKKHEMSLTIGCFLLCSDLLRLCFCRLLFRTWRRGDNPGVATGRLAMVHSQMLSNKKGLRHPNSTRKTHNQIQTTQPEKCPVKLKFAELKKISQWRQKVRWWDWIFGRVRAMFCRVVFCPLVGPEGEEGPSGILGDASANVC